MVSIITQTDVPATMPGQDGSITGLKVSSDMRLDFGNILATGKYSDFRIKCNEHTFNVHKAVLCSASPFFKAAMEGNTKVSGPNIQKHNPVHTEKSSMPPRFADSNTPSGARIEHTQHAGR